MRLGSAFGRGRLVFSSKGDPTRSETKLAPGSFSLVSSLVSSVGAVAEGLFATLFPADCRLCGSPLTNISRLPVCEECLCAMRPISGGLCSVCGERLASPYAFSDDGGNLRCGLCQRTRQPYVKAAAYGSYDGGLRELLHLLKYEQVRPAANVLGRMLAEVITGFVPAFSGPVVVVPVPLHQRKLRQRGFNQSELIARAALKSTDSAMELALSPQLLERRRETVSQIGLTSHQRRENIRGAFAVAKPEEVANRQILLVDDVFTTGTTVSECARVLLRAGASKVWVATVARTLKSEVQAIRLETSGEREQADRMTMAAKA